MWLFEQSGGEPIAADMARILIQFAVVCVVMGAIIVPAAVSNKVWFLVPSVALAFFVGMLILAPSMAQRQMLTECVTSDVEPTATTAAFALTKCRYKSNYYGEYGMWIPMLVEAVDN